MEIALANNVSPKIHHPILLITGDGLSLPKDLKVFRELCDKHDVLCIGRSYRLIYGPIDHWADVDGQESYSWAETLQVQWRNGPQRHTLGEMRGFDFFWIIKHTFYAMEDVMWCGSTSLFATVIAVAMGYEKIVLAGCPLDSNGHWYWANLKDNKGPRWEGETFMAWLDFCDTPESKKVRSLSGYTKIMLDSPTTQWLMESENG